MFYYFAFTAAKYSIVQLAASYKYIDDSLI